MTRSTSGFLIFVTCLAHSHRLVSYFVFLTLFRIPKKSIRQKSRPETTSGFGYETEIRSVWFYSTHVMIAVLEAQMLFTFNRVPVTESAPFYYSFNLCTTTVWLQVKSDQYRYPMGTCGYCNWFYVHILNMLRYCMYMYRSVA